MSKPWSELTPHEKDVRMAGAMGWVQVHPDLWERPGEELPAYTGERIIRTPCMPFHPSTDHNACRLVEDEIARRGLQEAFIRELDRLVVYERETGWAWFRWGVLHTTSDQCCQAAVQVLSKRGEP